MKVLILDDEKIFTSELCEFLNKSGLQAFEANTVALGKALLESETPDLLILDVRLPGADGLDLLKDFKAAYPDLEVIVVSGHGDMETVIRAMRLGAIDYLKKPFRHMDIKLALERTAKFIALQQRVRDVEEENSLISKSLGLKIERSLIGVSTGIRKVMELAMTAAEYNDTNVLITGESGTGKENIARIIHYASKRSEHLFCAVNSSSVTESLMESEFFGHKKGSFTGAISDRKGFFEIADQGTLFLDEIADMPLTLQAKVLRAIEERKITRVGETIPRSTDFRIIAATNADLDLLVNEKKMRLDLYHRLKTLHIHIPPLRERVDDIEPLLDYFITILSKKFNRLVPEVSEEVIDAIKQYAFPGNVRELRNLTERALILSKGKVLKISDFPLEVTPQVFSSDIPAKDLVANESDLLRKTLAECGFNQVKAAEILCISRDALIRRMKKYNIVVKKSG
jgi:DNA-binding NtrC family response regulator